MSRTLDRFAVSCRPRRRNFAITARAMNKLQAQFERTGMLPNPYNRGSYYFIIESLNALGVNKSHPFETMKLKARELMGEKRWRAFRGRARRRGRTMYAPDTECDADERIHYNCEVLQRLTDYGLKLLQVGQQIMKTRGCVIDRLQRSDGIHYALNTDSAKPLRAGRPRILFPADQSQEQDKVSEHDKVSGTFF